MSKFTKSRTTLFKLWEVLDKNCIVTETRKVGRATMYKLNRENPVVKKFMELDAVISDFYASQVEEV